MKPISFDCFIRLKASGGKGKPRRFKILAYSGGILPVDGFEYPVVIDLEGLEIPGAIPILIDHEKSVEATLGVTDNVVNTKTSLSMEGFVTGTSDKATRVIAAANQGHVWQASVGAYVVEREDVPSGKSVTVNGREFVGPIVIARRSTLRETSVLPMGADSATSVNLAASARRFLKGSAPMSFEEWVASLGLDMATLTPEAIAALNTSFASSGAAPAPVPAAAPAAPVVPAAAAAAGTLNLQAAAGGGEDPMAAYRRKISQTFAKSAQIQAMASGFPAIASKAIEEDWSVEKVELEVLKASAQRTRPTSFRSAEVAPENQGKVIEAAICMSRGFKNVEKSYDDKTLQAAHSQFRRGIGLQQLLLMAAAENGMYVAPGMRIGPGNIREVLYAAMPPQGVINATFSAISVPGILSNVANKETLEGYMEEDNTWEEITQVKSVNDFKTVTSYRLLDDMTYEKVGPGGKIKHGKIGEESFTRSADTYAKMFALTRTDIINDDMSKFDELREKLGRGSAMKLNDLYWSTFMGLLGTIFTAARTNYISGGTSNLGTDGVGLGLLQKAWYQRTSPTADGAKRLGGVPKILLVPPELMTIAEALYAAGNSANVKVSDVNTFAGKYKPLVAPQLSDSSITGYSSTHFFLLGDKSRGTPMVVSFLNGQRTPTIESADADFDTLGIQLRGYHDFGVDAADGYLNAVMSKGAA